MSSPTQRRASAASPGTDPDSEAAKKRRKGSVRLSCAECRRLKLKCDRNVPCGSCVKRGCSQICPDGSLTTGQGNRRFVLATTPELHEKIYELSSRVRELEDALRYSHSQLSPNTHALLADDLLRIKAPLQRSLAAQNAASASGSTGGAAGSAGGPKSEDDEDDPDLESLDAFGTLGISPSGTTKYYGQIANSWYFLQNENLSDDSPRAQDSAERERARSLASMLPPEVLNLSASFPLAPDSSINENSSAEAERLRGLFWFLPSAERAAYLKECYFNLAAWMYDPIPRIQFDESVWKHFYDPSASTPTDDPLGTHRLALVFMVLAIGSLMDKEQPSFNLEAEKYHQLARAAMLRSGMFDEPTLHAVQALFLMIFYLFFSDRHGTASGGRWAIMGITIKLAQSIGLHRDSSRFKVDNEETQRRRELFWELFTYDSWQCLTFGRPPSFSLAHIDCKFPYKDDDPTTSFHLWKHQFVTEVMSVVHDQAFGAKTPAYATVLALDKRVRAFAVPPVLQIVGFGQGASLSGAGGSNMSGPGEHEVPGMNEESLALQRHIVLAIREVTLLYMHRSFFARAISDHPKDPLGSPFGTSVIAAYRSAGSFIALLRNLDSQYPESAKKIWFLWTHMFSCSIILGSIVTRCPSMSLAPSALVQLDSACELFSKAAVSFRAQKVENIMLNLRDRARRAIAEFRATKSSPPTSRQNSVASSEKSLTLTIEGEDELSTLGGKTRLVKEISPISRSPNSQNPVVPLPLTNRPDQPVHPSVVEYLQTFSTYPMPGPLPTHSSVPIIMASDSSSSSMAFDGQTGMDITMGSSAMNGSYNPSSQVMSPSAFMYPTQHHLQLQGPAQGYSPQPYPVSSFPQAQAQAQAHARTPTTPMSMFDSSHPAFPSYFPVFDYNAPPLLGMGGSPESMNTNGMYGGQSMTQHLMQTPSGVGPNSFGVPSYAGNTGFPSERRSESQSPDMSMQNTWQDFVMQMGMN